MSQVDDAELKSLLDSSSNAPVNALHPLKQQSSSSNRPKPMMNLTNSSQPSYVQVESSEHEAETAELLSSTGTSVLNRLQSAFNQILILMSRIQPLIKNMDIATHQIKSYEKTVAEEMERYSGIVDAGVSESVDRDAKKKLRNGEIQPEEFHFVKSTKFHYAKDAIEAYKRIDGFKKKQEEYKEIATKGRVEFDGLMTQITSRMKTVMELEPKAKLPLHIEEDFDEMNVAFVAFERDRFSVEAFLRFQKEADEAFKAFEKVATARASKPDQQSNQVKRRQRQEDVSEVDYCLIQVQKVMACQCCTFWGREDPTRRI
jgi:hypothetical protein